MARRTLASAALSAALLGCHVVLLTLYLNPDVRLGADGSALLVALFLPYLLGGTVLLALAALAAAMVRGEGRHRRPTFGLPRLASFVFAVTSVSAALYFMNLMSYRHSIPAELVRRLAVSAVVLTACALVVIAVGVDALLFPARGRRTSVTLVALCTAATIAVPLLLRPPPPRTKPAPVSREGPPTDTVTPIRRITLIGADGIGPDLVRDGVAHGTLPAFEYLLRHGAHGPLGTLRPTEGPPVWTSIVTGCLPRDHGVKSFVTYRLRGSASVFELLPKGVLVSVLERAGLVSRWPVTSATRRRPALWNALNAFGIDAGVVRLWATHPVEPVRGFMLSPRLHTTPAGADPSRLLHPPDLIAEVRAQVVRQVDAGLVSGLMGTSTASPPDEELRRRLVEDALAPDLTYKRAGALLRSAYDPPFFATYFYGLDVVGHTSSHLARPGLLGGDDTDPAIRRGHVTERYARLIGEWVVDAVEKRRPDEIVVLVSGYGMEPASLLDQLVALLRGRGPLGGTHEHAPDGYMIAVGDGIRPGATLRSASVVDVAPTLLYLMGLPVARDMDGRVLTEILGEELARSHPLTMVPTYGIRQVRAEDATRPPREPEETLETGD